jgi:hypothetical protein
MRSKRVQRLETIDMRYLSRIPKKIPPGRVIAHNNILHGPNWPTGPKRLPRLDLDGNQGTR